MKRALRKREIEKVVGGRMAFHVVEKLVCKRVEELLLKKMQSETRRGDAGDAFRDRAGSYGCTCVDVGDLARIHP